MMHIPVDHGDAFNFFVPGLRIARSDGDVIKKAKTHRAIWRGVMARRTHGHKRIAGFTCRHCIDGATCRARSAKRCFERID